MMTDRDDSSSGQLLKIHGALAMTALIAVFPLSVAIAAAGRWWDLWLVTHIALVALGSVLLIASTACAVVGSQGHLVTTHQIAGTVLVILFAVLLATGIYISVRWDAARLETPLRDMSHWWLGRIIVIASFAICFQGFVVGEWDLWVYILVTICWLIWVCLYGTIKVLTASGRR